MAAEPGPKAKKAPGLKRQTTALWQSAMSKLGEMDLKKFTISKLLELQESVQQKADELQAQFDEMQKQTKESIEVQKTQLMEQLTNQEC